MTTGIRHGFGKFTNSDMRQKDTTLRQVETLVCRCCGQELPVSRFRRFATGTYRHTCNRCYWQHHGRAARMRRILRELEERKDIMDS